MRNIILSYLAISLLLAAPLSAAENQAVQTQNPSSSGSRYDTEGMGPGMMGPGSGYHGRGPGMMGYDRDMGRGMRWHFRANWADRRACEFACPVNGRGNRVNR